MHRMHVCNSGQVHITGRFHLLPFYYNKVIYLQEKQMTHVHTYILIEAVISMETRKINQSKIEIIRSSVLESISFVFLSVFFRV